jgi:hypothetical protein
MSENNGYSTFWRVVLRRVRTQCGQNSDFLTSQENDLAHF